MYSGQHASLQISITAGQVLVTPWSLAAHWTVSPHLETSGQSVLSSPPPPPDRIPGRASCRQTDCRREGSLPSGKSCSDFKAEFVK